MIKAKINIGKMHLTLEAQTMKEIFKWGGIYANLPKACDNCQSDELYLSHRGVKGFDYYSLKCGSCGAEGKFGQAKEGGSLFYKWDTKMEQYVAGPPKTDAPPPHTEEPAF